MHVREFGFGVFVSRFLILAQSLVSTKRRLSALTNTKEDAEKYHHAFVDPLTFYELPWIFPVWHVFNHREFDHASNHLGGKRS
jgi:hypothetical protein